MKSTWFVSVVFLLQLIFNVNIHAQQVLPEVTSNPLFFQNSKIGIGTSNPSETLDVIGRVKASSFHVRIPSGYTGYKSYFSLDDATGKYKMYLGGGTPFGPGSGWTPLFQTRNYDDYPALVLCAEWFGNNTSGRGIMVFDARKGNNGPSPLDQVAFEFCSGYGNRLLHIMGDGSLYSRANIEAKGIIRATEVKVEMLSSNHLNVDGNINASKINISASGQTADFVFDDNYPLRKLTEVEGFIKENKHLPEMPSAVAMEKNGVDLAEMNKLLLQKIEELTLYLIQQQKEIILLKKTVFTSTE